MKHRHPASPRRTIAVLMMVALAIPAGAGSAHAATSAAARPGTMVNATEAVTVAFQDRLNSALQKLLDAVVGPGRAVVTTAAEMDFDQVEATSDTYVQDPSVGALSEKLSRTSYTDGSGGARYESTSAVRANALNRLREIRRQAPGRVEKLNVAVLVDTSAGTTVDLAQLRNLVGVAAGIDSSRGDAVVVAAMPLTTTTVAVVDGDTGTEPATAPAVNRWQLAGAALALLLLVLVLVGWPKRRATRISARRDQQRPIRMAVDGPRKTAVAPPAVEGPRHEGLQRQPAISQFSNGDPERAAAALRGWVGR
jgi:flagellar M-ring protein FliF